MMTMKVGHAMASTIFVTNVKVSIVETNIRIYLVATGLAHAKQNNTSPIFTPAQVCAFSPAVTQVRRISHPPKTSPGAAPGI
jgi:hypothetical protein